MSYKNQAKSRTFGRHAEYSTNVTRDQELSEAVRLLQTRVDISGAELAPMFHVLPYIVWLTFFLTLMRKWLI